MRRFSSSAFHGPSCSSTGRPGTRPARWCSLWIRFQERTRASHRRSRRPGRRRSARSDPGGRRGNPLFVEQMRALAVEGAPSAAIPPSIHALLAARLDRLAEEERRARAGGRDRAGVHNRRGQLLSGDQPMGSMLLSLVRRDLIEPDRSLIPGDDGFRFRHILIRDAAYLRRRQGEPGQAPQALRGVAGGRRARPGRLSAITSSRPSATARSSGLPTRHSPGARGRLAASGAPCGDPRRPPSRHDPLDPAAALYPMQTASGGSPSDPGDRAHAYG